MAPSVVYAPQPGESSLAPVSGSGGHAPDGTPITPAALKGRGRALARALGGLADAAARLLQWLRPEAPDGPAPEPPAPDPSSRLPHPDPPPDPTDDKVKPSPPGVTFTVRGNTTTELGRSYSEQVREFFEGEPVPNSRAAGSANPDGLIVIDTVMGPTAIEAKFISDWSASIYNPNLRRSFPHNAVREAIDQASKYAEAYPAGVEWVTNSLDFATSYARLFAKASIKNFHFTVIPAVRRTLDGTCS